MLILIIQYLKGYLRIRIEGYSPERFLNLCSHHQIYLWNLIPAGHAYEMNISIRGFRALRPILRKTGTKIIIKERRGLPFFLHKYRKRKVFLEGAILCICAIYLFSFFIWNIQIDGNRTRTDEVLTEFLKEQGISRGILKKEINCTQIVREIRKRYDDIIWVSAYVKGTRLMIQVKENEDRQEEEPSGEEAPMDLIAKKDGVITKMITRKGVPLIHEGDEVKKGDILVSGTVEVLNDAKEVIGYQYQIAEADIVARTSIDYSDSLLISYEKKVKTGKSGMHIWIRTPERICSLGLENGLEKSYVSTSTEKQIKLGGRFEIPIFYGSERREEYKIQVEERSQKEYQEILTGRFRIFCQNLEEKGVQILGNDVKIYKETASASARGTLTLSEEIGMMAQGEKQVLPPAAEEFENQEGN